MGNCNDIEKCRSFNEIVSIAFCLLKNKLQDNARPIIKSFMGNQASNDTVSIKIEFIKNIMNEADRTRINLCIPVDKSMNASIVNTDC
jgi:hypothetical protein